MFKFLEENPSEDQYYEADLFPLEERYYTIYLGIIDLATYSFVYCCSEITITAVKEWLKSLPIYNMQPVECGSDTLNESHITEIERAIENMKVYI